MRVATVSTRDLHALAGRGQPDRDREQRERSDTQSVTAMADQTYSIVPGGSPVTIATHSAGENAWLTFDAQADQRIALKMSGVTMGPALLLDLRLDLQARRHRPRLADARRHERRLHRHRVLPATGRYKILVDPQATSTGSMTLTLYDVPPT